MEEVKKDDQPTVNVKSLKKELDEFKTEVRENTNRILDVLEGFKKPEQTVQELPHNSDTAISHNTVRPPLAQQYQMIFEEYFDTKDGFYAEMSFENTISFTIVVPLKFSREQQAYLDYYKTDRRTKVLQQGDIEGGIRRWCDLVAKNLKYNKNAQLK